MNILVDSDVLIEVLRDRNPRIVVTWRILISSRAAMFCSPVSVAELWQGARPSEQQGLEALFSALPCLPMDGEIGRRAGEYLRRYGRSHSVELGVALIAATASLHGLQVWTRNRKHYPMQDVRLLDAAAVP